MDPNDLVRVQHAVTGGVFDTTRQALNDVWGPLGWAEVADATPLTDQIYTSGEEPQPPPPTPGEQFPDEP